MHLATKAPTGQEHYSHWLSANPYGKVGAHNWTEQGMCALIKAKRTLTRLSCDMDPASWALEMREWSASYVEGRATIQKSRAILPGLSVH